MIQRPVQRVLDQTLFDLERELGVDRWARRSNVTTDAFSPRPVAHYQGELYFGNLRDSLLSIFVLFKRFIVRLWLRVLFGERDEGHF